MLLALSATVIVIVALLWEAWRGRPLKEAYERHRARRRDRPGLDGLRPRPRAPRRAARPRAAALVRQRGGVGDVPRPRVHPGLGRARAGAARSGGGSAGERRPAGAPYAYLVYPHKPIVAYLPQTRELLSEYCVEFPDETRPYGSARLPDSDDVLAKWMALTGDERRVIGLANMHLPGRQVDPKQVRRDLWRLSPVGARPRLERSSPLRRVGVPAP